MENQNTLEQIEISKKESVMSENNSFKHNSILNSADQHRLELSLAPMLKVTTPCFRYLTRLLHPTVVLYTEMIVASTVIHSDLEYVKFILGEPESNTVVQLGGSDPEQISKAVRILLECGYSLFNLNCGCPSDRVQKGMFGAILMNYKELVSDIINKVFGSTGVILSVKTRIGVDQNDSYGFFRDFMSYIIKNSPCRIFYIHARKCWLKGLNPKQNRNIPELKYDYVYRIKKEFPECFIGINGGINKKSLLRNIEEIEKLDGVMIGRESVNTPEVFNEIEQELNNLKSKDCDSVCTNDIISQTKETNIAENSPVTFEPATTLLSTPHLVDMHKILSDYLMHFCSSEYSRSKILSPLVNLRKGRWNSKNYKREINEITQSKIEMSGGEMYQRIIKHFVNPPEHLKEE